MRRLAASRPGLRVDAENLQVGWVASVETTAMLEALLGSAVPAGLCSATVFVMSSEPRQSDSHRADAVRQAETDLAQLDDPAAIAPLATAS